MCERFAVKKNARNLYLKRGSWWFAQQVKGKRQWINLHTNDEAEAVRFRRLARANPIIRPETGLLPDVDAYVEYKVKNRLHSKNSADTKVLCLRAFARWLPETATLANVTSEQCDGFYRAVQQPGFDQDTRRKLKEPPRPASESTAHGYMMTLRAFFRWAVETRRVRFDNPVTRLEFGRVDHKVRRGFIDKAAKNFLIASATNDDLRFVLFCGFDAGLRRDEIAEARRDWFDLKGGNLQVRNAKKPPRLRAGERKFRVKNGKERHVPLTHPFCTFLKKYLEGLHPLDFVLRPEVRHGTARYRYDVRRPFGEFVAEQRMPFVTQHVMRHSFASNLKIAGISIAKIADWLGDTERATEKNYSHLMPHDQDIHALT